MAQPWRKNPIRDTNIWMDWLDGGVTYKQLSKKYGVSATQIGIIIGKIERRIEEKFSAAIESYQLRKEVKAKAVVLSVEPVARYTAQRATEKEIVTHMLRVVGFIDSGNTKMANQAWRDAEQSTRNLRTLLDQKYWRGR